MIVRMTRLYIRLVTHARLHIMTSVVCLQFFTCLLSARLFMLLLFSCLFIMLFNYLMFAVILLLFCAHCLYARVVLFTHTHSPGRFLTTLNLHVQILDALFLLCRCLMRLYALRGAGRSPF